MALKKISVLSNVSQRLKRNSSMLRKKVVKISKKIIKKIKIQRDVALDKIDMMMY